MSQSYKKDVLRFALFRGELMLSNGAETYRVEDSILRICKSRGFNHINVFTSPTVIIISDDRFDGLSFMKTIKKRGINLEKVSLLNNFSREFVNNKDLKIDDAMEMLKKINNKNTYSPIITYICAGIGCAFFALLLGGNDIITFLLTFITSTTSLMIFDKVMSLSNIPAFSSLITATFIAIIGVFITELNILETPKMLIVGSIMPLLPGVSFIKGLRDLISGDLISGVARSFDATITAISIACGVGLVLEVWFNFGGSF